MFYIRILVILVITILALTATDSFAATGSTMIGSGSVTSKITDIQKDETIITENSIEDRKKEQNAQKIILEVYKLQ